MGGGGKKFVWYHANVDLIKESKRLRKRTLWSINNPAAKNQFLECKHFLLIWVGQNNRKTFKHNAIQYNQTIYHSLKNKILQIKKTCTLKGIFTLDQTSDQRSNRMMLDLIDYS